MRICIAGCTHIETCNKKKLSATQVLEALQCTRQLGIIHGDLKADNVLLAPQAQGGKRGTRGTGGTCFGHWDNFKLIDFGCAAYVDGHISTYIQSRFYRAPEVVLDVGPITPAIDMWSLGTV
jgi:serine/threonine protein kinase